MDSLKKLKELAKRRKEERKRKDAIRKHLNDFATLTKDLNDHYNVNLQATYRSIRSARRVLASDAPGAELKALEFLLSGARSLHVAIMDDHRLRAEDREALRKILEQIDKLG